MARDWSRITTLIESYYPKAAGTITGSNQDETLRLNLVPYANAVFIEISEMQRWQYSYGTASILTAAGTATYAIPDNIREISNIYYLDTGGQQRRIDGPFSLQELRQWYGEGALSTSGKPRRYALIGGSLQLFPVPDATGPTAGNYSLIVEGYTRLTEIVETTGTSVAATTTVTIPSSEFVILEGVADSVSTNVAVTFAGPLGASSLASTHLTTGTVTAGVPSITLAVATTTAVPTARPVYFNPTNWLITNFHKTLLFGVLREVASYLKSDYQVWEARYQHEIELMREHDADRSRAAEMLASAGHGQRRPQLRDVDASQIVELRGV